MLTALLWVAVAGLTGSAIYLGLVLLAAGRFTGSKRDVPNINSWPGVSLLKPLYGEEPRLRENLESFFRLRYPQFEIVFGARNAQDPALRVVEELRREYPWVAASVVLAGEPDRPNAKVCAMTRMVAETQYEYLVISDSDVHVEPNYIQSVIHPLLDPGVGLVTCLYRGVPTGGPWSRLEAMGMSVEMTSGVLVADMLEGMKFALGPTMATRKDALARIGGMGALADYCSDDYVLGQFIAENGMEVVLSQHVIDHVVLNSSMRSSLIHQARWMKSTRCSRPLGHVGAGMTFATPFGILGFIAGVLSGHAGLGVAMLVLGLANRVVQALVVGWGVVRDRESLRYCWAYPVRDLLGFALWAWSFMGGRDIVWRGEKYRLLSRGQMVRAGSNAPPSPPKSPPRPEPAGMPR
jgi:ceramide glucosyltransferase